MAIFNSYVTNYQRVSWIFPCVSFFSLGFSHTNTSPPLQQHEAPSSTGRRCSLPSGPSPMEEVFSGEFLVLGGGFMGCNWYTVARKSKRQYTGWWFGTFFIFAYIGNNHPNWLIFFRGGWNHQLDKYDWIWLGRVFSGPAILQVQLPRKLPHEPATSELFSSPVGWFVWGIKHHPRTGNLIIPLRTNGWIFVWNDISGCWRMLTWF